MFFTMLVLFGDLLKLIGNVVKWIVIMALVFSPAVASLIFVIVKHLNNDIGLTVCVFAGGINILAIFAIMSFHFEMETYFSGVTLRGDKTRELMISKMNAMKHPKVGLLRASEKPTKD